MISYIEDGLADTVVKLKDSKFKSIAFPALGCGLGGLNWLEVKGLMVDFAKALPEMHVIVYEPQ